jgi:hypothetical protein
MNGLIYLAVLLICNLRESFTITLQPAFLSHDEIQTYYHLATNLTALNDDTIVGAGSQRISNPVVIDANLHQRIQHSLMVHDSNTYTGTADTNTADTCTAFTETATYVTSIVRSTSPHKDHYRVTNDVSTHSMYTREIHTRRKLTFLSSIILRVN